MAEFDYLLKNEDHYTLFWKWEENQNNPFLVALLKQFQRLSSPAWCDINTFKLTSLWALISLRDQYLLEISRLYCSENFEEHFTLQVAPQGGSIFRSGISVPLWKVLYACAVFRSNLVLFLFHSEGAALYLFLLFGFLFSSSLGQIYILWFIQAETSTSSNEELWSSDVSEYESSFNE